MLRLKSSLLRRARNLHPLLPRLLRPCRDLNLAQNELRWLREHALELENETRSRSKHNGWYQKLRRLCREREKGKPLQYVLGSQPFGDLEILCRKDVLIPRYASSSHSWIYSC